MTNSATTKKLPFSMLFLDLISNKERGYVLSDNNNNYNPKSQVVTFNAMEGSTSPTTYSRVGSTGIINTDTDESSDDQGTD